MKQFDSAMRDLKAWYEAGFGQSLSSPVELQEWYRLGAHVIDAVDKSVRPPEGDCEL